MKLRKKSNVFIYMKSNRGFTLLEVMVGMFVSVIMIAAVLTSIVQILKQTEVTKCRTVAVALLTNKIEENRRLPFSALSASLKYPSYLGGTYTINDREYQWARSTVTLSEPTTFGSVQVLTTVSWTTLGKSYSIDSTSYVSPNGIVSKTSL